MRNGYNNGGLLRVSRCSVFVMNLLVLLEYTGCYCGISCSFLTLVCVTTVPYRIVSSSERIAICTIASVSAIYRCAGVSFQPYHEVTSQPCQKFIWGACQHIDGFVQERRNSRGHMQGTGQWRVQKQSFLVFAARRILLPSPQLWFVPSRFQPCLTNLPTVKRPFHVGWFCSCVSVLNNICYRQGVIWFHVNLL